MKLIWNSIEAMNINVGIKNKLFIAALIVVSAAIGGLAWMAIGRWVMSEDIWMLAFMGYPAVFVGMFGGILYLWNNEFS